MDTDELRDKLLALYPGIEVEERGLWRPRDNYAALDIEYKGIDLQVIYAAGTYVINDTAGSIIEATEVDTIGEALEIIKELLLV